MRYTIGIMIKKTLGIAVIGIIALVATTARHVSSLMKLLGTYLEHIPTMGKIELILFMGTWLGIVGVVMAFKEKLDKTKTAIEGLSKEQKVLRTDLDKTKYDLEKAITKMDGHMREITLILRGHGKTTTEIKEHLQLMDQNILELAKERR